MSDIHSRPFSKDYSGLINQSVIASCIAILAVIVQESFKRRRRGEPRGEGLGSRESWEFGYLYQGRSWAKHPSPPTPAGWPLSWVKPVVRYPEDDLRRLRGLDATLYIRFLRGCFWFCLLQTCTTFLILFPIHVHFSEDSIPSKSMTRASISSLVLNQRGLSLLWIHISLLFWVTLTWMATLVWICKGAFRLRAHQIEEIAKRLSDGEENTQHHPHPHPQYRFLDTPLSEQPQLTNGLRLRTVMVSNIPLHLRSEKELKEYFEYFMSRPLDKPSVGLTSSTQPGFFNKWFAFLFNRAKRIPAHLPSLPTATAHTGGDGDSAANDADFSNIPVIDRVVVARKMVELASLLERREEVLRRLETAHIKLAKKALIVAMHAMDGKPTPKRWNPRYPANPLSYFLPKPTKISPAKHVESGDDDEARMKILVDTLAPFIDEFDLRQLMVPRSKKILAKSRYAFRKLLRGSNHENGADTEMNSAPSPPGRFPSIKAPNSQRTTIWEVLLRLDRDILDRFQPLINLSHLFRDKTVPAIDYYTAKLGLLTSIITENRAKATRDYDPVSTAFVTFADPLDARKACKYLAVHPNNPLACLVTMAPGYNDIDWKRVMKSNFRVEFLKDWVIQLGVWAFTIFWIFPLSLLVGLVSITSISNFLPSLKDYLKRHPWENEFIESFLPTLLVALLALLIPLVLLLIAKKVHTITTLSALHDLIMSRYYKFLIVNVLVFFCVGTAALQSFLASFRSTTPVDIIDVVASSFPTAGPFYVGWLLFTVGMHGGFELALFGLPLITYPSTRRQVTPRKRTVGIRPRTFNFYYWLPAHVLVMHVILLFAILNPLVLPFAMFYFFIEAGVVKNQLIHVYAKNYECNGQVILVRVIRYSLDGLMFAQAVFMAYMVVLEKKDVNVGLAAFLVIFTAIVKIWVTRICRFQFEADDILEAQILCGQGAGTSQYRSVDEGGSNAGEPSNPPTTLPHSELSAITWRLPDWINFSYSSVRHRIHPPERRPPNPFAPRHYTFSRLDSILLAPGKIQSETIGGADVPQKDLSDQGQQNICPPEHQPEHNASVQLAAQPNYPEPPGLVVPHPPPIPWDDQPIGDLPYDNPYYTRDINNALWLPRNPFGNLDLDDTVDVYTSITVDPQAAQLGSWSRFPEMSPKLRPTSIASGAITWGPLRKQYTGTEEIDLPLTIAKRVQALENEDDVEETTPRRPSIFGARRPSAGEKDKAITRKASVLDEASPTSFPPFLAGTGDHPGPSSIMAAMESPQKVHSMLEHEPLARPEQTASGSRLSVAAPPLSRTITTQEAVVSEVLAEENAALVGRLKEEQVEKESRSVKHWLTSWMFTRAD